MLDLNGEKAEVLKLLNTISIGGSSKIAVTLIELGYFTEAKKQCETNWQNKFFWNYSRDQFSKKLEVNLPEFLKVFNDKGDRYFAEVYLSWLKNVYGDKTIKSTQESRLKALAERFSSDYFKSKSKRQSALILLCDSHSESKAFARALAKEVEGISIKSILLSEENSDFKAKLFGVYLSAEIEQGNFEPVQSTWKQINDVLAESFTGNIPWRVKSHIDKLSEVADQSFCRLIKVQTPEQIVKMLPVLRDLNRHAYQRPLNQNLNQLAHLMAGRPDELTKFLQEQDDDLKANSKTPVEKPTKTNKFFDALSQQIRKIKTKNDAIKKNVLVHGWKFASEQGFSFGSEDFEAGLMDPSMKSRTRYGIGYLELIRIVNSKELLKLAPELASINSVNGGIWLQLARRQVAAKQDAKAAESFKKSIEDAKEDMQKARFNRRVEYANTLLKLKRNDEAKKMIEGIPVKELFKANQKTLKELQEKLK